MTCESKKLGISGLAGIIVASLVITSIVLAPLPRKATTPSSSGSPPLLPPGWPSGSFDVQAFISNLTVPLGVGSEGDLTVAVASTCDASNVVVEFDLLQVSSEWPTGIDFIGENTTTTKVVWNGDLKANVSMIFTQRIKAVEVGYARIAATVSWSTPALQGFTYITIDRIWISVLENDVQVSHNPIAPSGQMPFLPGLPINVTTGSL
ncbi:MAG: hypothetical protein ABSB28_09770 [Candidatus Bathyarchaeia archaeon]